MGEQQLSLLATVTLAWAAIYGYVAVYSFTLQGYSAAERELRPFSIATFGMMIYAVGAALVADATSTAAVVDGYRVVFCGGWLAAAGFMHFAHALTERPFGRLVSTSYTLALVGIVAILSGLFLDPTMPATTHRMWIHGLRDPLVPFMTVGYVAVTLPALFVISSAAWIMQTPRGAPDQRWLAFSGALLSIAAIHDAVINLLPWRSVYLLEHCYLLCALAMTHHLLGRVARTDDELTSRRQQLRESFIDLQRTEIELANKEQLAAVGELSAIIAQEVRHPIAVMRRAISTLHKESTPLEQRHENLDAVDQESDRLNHLVGDLLTYAKPMHAQINRVPISAMIERAVTGAMTSPPGVRVEIRLGERPTEIECDAELVHQALRNLIDNAVTALHGTGALTIETSEITFRGSPALRLSIFGSSPAPNQPEATARDSQPSVRPVGTGLGLAIVDRVVRAHQGHIEIREYAAGDPTILLTLPLHVDEATSNPPVDAATFSSLFAEPSKATRRP